LNNIVFFLKENKCFILVVSILVFIALYEIKPTNSIQQQSIVIGSEYKTDKNPYKIAYDKCKLIGRQDLREKCIEWEIKSATKR